MAKIGSGMAADTVILFQLGAGAPWALAALYVQPVAA